MPAGSPYERRRSSGDEAAMNPAGAGASGTRGDDTGIHRAPPLGRALRLALGVVLTAYVIPVYYRQGAAFAVGTLLVLAALLVTYSALLVFLARHVIASRGIVGGAIALGVLVAVYLAGATHLPLVGQGRGELVAVTFLGVSLVVAGLRADPGCEVMAIPGALLRRTAELPCLFFSPLDALEWKWRRRRRSRGGGAGH
jgi:hypothetical protein